MAGFAALYLVRRAYVILRDQVFAHAHLVDKFLRMLHRLAGDLIVRTIQRAVACSLLAVNRIVAVRSPPSDVKDRIARRTDVLRRIPMTVEAPLHLETRMRVGQRHLVYRSVARGTTDSLINVDLVIEIHVVGQIVELRPPDWSVVAITRAHRLENVGIRPDLRMAVHTRFGRRNSGKAGVLHRRVTVPAIESETRNVVLMTEWNRLLQPLALLRDVGRTLQFVQRERQAGDDEPQDDKAHPCKPIGTSVKNLWHRNVS
jgi:hypothetical protein